MRSNIAGASLKINENARYELAACPSFNSTAIATNVPGRVGIFIW